MSMNGWGARGALSRASLTLRLRPFSSFPSNFSMAADTDDASPNSMNANPRGLSVARSTGRKTSVTGPASANSVSRSA